MKRYVEDEDKMSEKDAVFLFFFSNVVYVWPNGKV